MMFLRLWNRYQHEREGGPPAWRNTWNWTRKDNHLDQWRPSFVAISKSMRRIWTPQRDGKASHAMKENAYSNVCTQVNIIIASCVTVDTCPYPQVLCATLHLKWHVQDTPKTSATYTVDPKALHFGPPFEFTCMSNWFCLECYFVGIQCTNVGNVGQICFQGTTLVFGKWRSCLASTLADVRTLRQSVREVDAANYNEGPYQYPLEIKSAHR